MHIQNISKAALLKVILAALVLLPPQSLVAEWYIDTDVIKSLAIPNLNSLDESSPVDLRRDKYSSVSLISGYRSGRFFSVQLEYQDQLAFGIDGMFAGSSLWFPQTEPMNFASNALFISGISSYPITDDSSLYMKGGVFNWEIDAELLDRNENILGKTRGTDIFYGLGANYDLNARFEISAEWERYRMAESDVDYLSTEFTFKF